MNLSPLAACAAAATLALAAPTRANDSTAELAAGGLVLTRTDAIEMKSEDLFVSEAEIRVTYRFLNTSGRDVTTRVAFPMPDIGGESFFFQDTAIPDRDAPANVLDFKTLVDGRPRKMEIEQRAVVGDVDHTDWLTKRGVPLALHLDAAVPALDGLSKEDQAEAIVRGLALPDDYDAGKGMERHLAPAWTLKTAFHWEETFPAGRVVKVEHRYRPAAGGSVGTIVGAPGFEAMEEWPATQGRYCIDKAFLGAVTRGKGRTEYPPFTETRIGYILKTGGNWAKPIGDFRLVVDKGAPRNLVSFCGDGVRKIGSTRFEVRRSNWTPTDDLWVLILKPYLAD